MTAGIIDPGVRQAWRKQAASASSIASQTSQQDVEKAFLDQAYMLIQNKGTPLMKAPYRVGFEIVFKNDDNNRLVGIFVFKVDQDLYYAPCFFLGGTIKGTDLLYRHTEKQFVPLTSDWAEYLISQADISLGDGVPMSERSFTRHQLELRDLAQPPNTHQAWRKYSSAGVQDPDIRAFWNAHKDMLKPAAETESLLKKFMEEDGGMPAREQLAKTVKKKPAFGKALMKHSRPEHFAPEMHKKEASVAEPILVLRTNLLNNPGVKAASTKEIQQGWQIEDFRKDAEVNGDVYSDPAIYLEQATEPGVYDMLTSDGDLGPYLACFELPSGTLRSDCPSESIPPYYPTRSERRVMVFVNLKDKESCCIPLSVGFHSRADHGALGKRTAEVKDCDKLVDSPTSGKAWRLVDLRKKQISDPFFVTDTDKSPGGLTQVWIAHYDKENTERLPLLLNPEVDGFDEPEKICGKDIKFIEVHCCPMKEGETRLEFGKNIRLGGSEALRDLIFNNHYKRASVIRVHEDEYLVEIETPAGKNRSGLMDKMATTVYLASRCNLRVAAAEEVLEQVKSASGRRAHAFYFQPFVKEGYNISFNEWPNLHATGNTEFQTLEEPHIQDLIQARRDEPYIVPHRIGDMRKHEGINSVRDMAADTPMSLAEQSQNRGVSSLFEHGVVGELVKTYDATALVDKYMPELLVGLDRLGRLLFLLYWKPQDFAQDYGSDDQTELENQMLSNFKQQGELVLSLLQKSEALKRPDSIGARMP